jgi:hypothetical protein
LLQRAADLAARRLSALLRAAEGVAASVGRSCYKWRPRPATRSSWSCCKQWRRSLPAGGGGCYQQRPASLQKVAYLAAKGVCACCKVDGPAGGATSSSGATASDDGDGTASGAVALPRAAVVSSDFFSILLVAASGAQCPRGDDNWIFFFFLLRGMWVAGSTHVVEVEENVSRACS